MSPEPAASSNAGAALTNGSRWLSSASGFALGLAALIVASVSSADSPNDFAWQWSLPLNGDEGLVMLVLDEQVYRQLQRSDLGDLAAFNAAGNSIPLAPFPGPAASQETPAPPAAQSVPWFRSPRGQVHSQDAFPAVMPLGSGTHMISIPGSADLESTGEQILINLSSLETAITGLTLAFDELPEQGLNARVNVEASNDLSRWQPLASDLALVDLRSEGTRLQRHELRFPATRMPYLRLLRSDSRQILPLSSVHALPQGTQQVSSTTPLHELSISGAADPGTPGGFIYRPGGPFPITRVNVVPVDANAAADVVLSTRASPEQPWRQRARFSAFRLDSDTLPVRNLPIALATIRDPEWRVQTQPPLAEAPQLELGYAPERFLLLSQGEAPFTLAAGSLRANPAKHPLQPILAQLRSVHGAEWQPPQIAIGEGSMLAGDAALRAKRGPDIWLWAVLLAGVAAILAMVISLLRTPGSQASGTEQ